MGAGIVKAKTLLVCSRSALRALLLKPKATAKKGMHIQDNAVGIPKRTKTADTTRQRKLNKPPVLKNR